MTKIYLLGADELVTISTAIDGCDANPTWDLQIWDETQTVDYSGDIYSDIPQGSSIEFKPNAPGDSQDLGIPFVDGVASIKLIFSNPCLCSQVIDLELILCETLVIEEIENVGTGTISTPSLTNYDVLCYSAAPAGYVLVPDVSGDFGDVTYAWSSNISGDTTTTANWDITDIIINHRATLAPYVGSTATFTLDVLGGNEVCTETFTFNVVILPEPNITFPEVCIENGAVITLENANQFPSSTILWSADGDPIIHDSTGSTAEFEWSEAGVYNIDLSITINGVTCSFPDVGSVNVSSIGSITINGIEIL